MASVIVVGAGPTGLVAALLLARRGVECTVLDRHDSPYPLPRAVHLDDAAVRILQRAGLAESFGAISRPGAGLRLLDAHRRPFAEFRRDGENGFHGHPESNLFDQPQLEDVLRAAAAREPRIRLRMGMEVLGVEQPPRGATSATVIARSGGSGASETMTADAVLGCDGAASTVRDALGVGMRELARSERWLVVDVLCQAELPSWGGVDQVCDPRRAATFLHVAGNRYRWEFRLRPDESARELAEPRRLAALLAPWGVSPESMRVLRAADYDFGARTARRWRAGRVLLLGDAAHQTPPFIGSGLGLGLHDADNVTWKLASLLRGPPPWPGDEDQLLDTYQLERATHAEAAIRGALRVGRAMTGGGRVGAMLRRPLTQALLRVPALRERAAEQIGVRYPASALVAARTRRSELAGTPCPQPTVGFDGQLRPLDEVLGDTFVVLAAGPVGDTLQRRAAALQARVLRIGSPDAAADLVDPDGVLIRWLGRGGTTAALVRPDRVVAATTG